MHATPIARARSRLLVSTMLSVGLIFSPSSAFAHGNLKSSLPAAGAVVTHLPRFLRLDFTEAPELAFTRVTVTGPDGDTLALSTLRFAAESRRSVLAGLPATGNEGTYTVVWRMAGADGHPMQGRFSFAVRWASGAVSGSAVRTHPAGEAAGHVTAPGQTAPPAAHHRASADPEEASFDASSPFYVVIRWAQFIGLLIVFGAIAFSIFVLGRLSRMEHARAYTIRWARHRAASGAIIATVLVGVAALLRLWAQTYAMHGNPVFDISLVGAMLTQTVWGWGWLAQLVGALVAGIGFLGAKLGVARGWAIAMIGAVILAFTPALSGHAVASPSFTRLAVGVDAVHVMAAGGWLGSLFCLVTAGIPEALRLEEGARSRAVADFVNAFSPTALVFAAITALTGAATAWLHLGTLSALWQSQYGQRLLLKLAILSIAAGTGAYNWLHVRPRLGSRRGTVRMRRSASVELAMGVLVLLATAILVATPTAVDVTAMNP